MYETKDGPGTDCVRGGVLGRWRVQQKLSVESVVEGHTEGSRVSVDRRRRRRKVTEVRRQA